MMKIIFLALILVSADVFAQQAPGAITQPPPPVPPPPAAPTATLSDEELMQLLRAQTAAIKSLSSRLDTFEQRLLVIEQGSRP